MLNMRQKCGTLLTRHDDSQRFLMAIAESNVPRVQQLVYQALKSSVNIKEIIHQIENSVNKIYQVRGYIQIDLDMAMLCY